MTRPALYFIRHGETDWNRVGRLQGQLDIPINATGERQASRNASALAELLDRPAELDFVASPLLRARQTMELVRSGLGLAAASYRTDDRLKEIRFGAWEGFSWKELKASDRPAYDRRKADPWAASPPGGESYAELSARISGWLETMRTEAVVVSHGGVSRCLRGLVLSLDPGEIPHLDVPQDRIMVVGDRRIDWI